MNKLQTNYKDKYSLITNIVLFVLIAVIVLQVLFNIIYFRVYIVGSSMNGTFVGAKSIDAAGGDYVYAYRFCKPDRGDVAVIKTPSKTLIKRVVALGGDSVELKEGVLYINGSPKDEPYVSAENNTPSLNNYPLTYVPVGYMFCLGDNRDNSSDSRSGEYGCMPIEWTEGIVAAWSVSMKSALTAMNTFIDFTVPEAFGA